MRGTVHQGFPGATEQSGTPSSGRQSPEWMYKQPSSRWLKTTNKRHFSHNNMVRKHLRCSAARLSGIIQLDLCNCPLGVASQIKVVWVPLMKQCECVTIQVMYSQMLVVVTRFGTECI